MRPILMGIGTWIATVILLFALFFGFALLIGNAMPTGRQIGAGMAAGALIVGGMTTWFARSAAPASVGTGVWMVVVILFALFQIATYLFWLFISMVGLNR